MLERIFRFAGGVVLAVCGTVVLWKGITAVLTLSEANLAGMGFFFTVIIGGMLYCFAYVLLRE